MIGELWFDEVRSELLLILGRDPGFAIRLLVLSSTSCTVPSHQTVRIMSVKNVWLSISGMKRLA